MVYSAGNGDHQNQLSVPFREFLGGGKFAEKIPNQRLVAQAVPWQCGEQVAE